MTEPFTIELREYGKGVTFSPSAEERSALRRFSHALATRDISSTLVEISSNNDFVGGVLLSPRTRVVVKPKVPIQSLLQLILIASGVDSIPQLKGIDAYARGSVTDWLVMMLVLEVRRLISMGLRRGYVPTAQRLHLIRGRIDFARSLKYSWDVSKVACRYTPFTINTPEHQILLGTLEAMSRHNLIPEVRHAVDETISLFEGVSIRPVRILDFEKIQINRLNRHYESAMALCRLFAEGSALEFGQGTVLGSAFFLSMNALFEQAVTNSLRATSPRVYPQRPVKPFGFMGGTPQIPITLIPDVTLMDSYGRPALVVDAKYKRAIISGQFGRSFDNANIYQIVTYAEALRCPAMLVYPQTDEPVNASFTLNEVRFNIVTINLAGDVRDAMASFAEYVHRNINNAPAEAS